MTARRSLLLLAPLLLVACTRQDDAPLEASGTVEATEADLAFPYPGRLATVLAREGDRVHAGQQVAAQDTVEAAARRQGALAQLQAARAMLQELLAGARGEELTQARLALEAAEQRLAGQSRETARTVGLAEGGAVSRERREQAETALRIAEAERDRLAAQVALLEAGTRAERITAARATVAQAEADVAQAEAMLANLVLAAPFDGVVSVRHREPGEVAGAGMPVLSIIDPDDRWVRVYVPQDRVGRLQVGQAATIRTDAFPDRPVAGTIVAIATEAEFTPRNVQTREERVRLVHAVRVRVTGDPDLLAKPGLAADVRFEVPPG